MSLNFKIFLFFIKLKLSGFTDRKRSIFYTKFTKLKYLLFFFKLCKSSLKLSNIFVIKLKITFLYSNILSHN